jgi:dTDP-4-amino-4,6-dideoxygalactose transaminase
MEHMKSQGIQTSIHYPPIHKFTSYEDGKNLYKITLPITEDVANRELTLPLYPTLTEDEVNEVVKSVQEAIPASKILSMGRKI